MLLLHLCAAQLRRPQPLPLGRAALAFRAPSPPSFPLPLALGRSLSLFSPCISQRCCCCFAVPTHAHFCGTPVFWKPHMLPSPSTLPLAPCIFCSPTSSAQPPTHSALGVHPCVHPCQPLSPFPAPHKPTRPTLAAASSGMLSHAVPRTHVRHHDTQTNLRRPQCPPSAVTSFCAVPLATNRALAPVYLCLCLSSPPYALSLHPQDPPPSPASRATTAALSRLFATHVTPLSPPMQQAGWGCGNAGAVARAEAAEMTARRRSTRQRQRVASRPQTAQQQAGTLKTCSCD